MKISILEKFKKVVTTALIAAITIGSTGIVHANSSQSESLKDSKQISYERMLETCKNSTVLAGDDLASAINLFSNDLSGHKFNVYVSDENLDIKNAKSLDIKDDGDRYTSVSVPIVGEDYSMLSNLTVVYDENNDVITYTESLLTKSDNNTFMLTSFADGEQVNKKDTGLKYMTNQELKKEIKELEEVGSDTEIQSGKASRASAGKIAACIAGVTGLGGTAAYAIVAMCAGSCPAVPPICAACIGAAATLGSAGIAGVVACFNLK